MESPQGFAEEIDFDELQIIQIVGKGAFGVVSKARWREKDVAVKLIETESERKAFLTELKQLSRVSHPNIVRLLGASTKAPVCLVMEYAEGGSLYNVLHGTNGEQAHYTAAHAMSWLLQCARGVEYLHSMKPKALIHRDLKPPNLLLIMGGTVLKICDFGTACDAQTHMTNNKGSAAWMAPEVFEGCNYSEKCDVFSWGIILWEVFTRRKPFDEIGGPAFRIMWAVHNGTRPPLIKNLPKPLELLMTRCWSSNAPERPSMSEVVRIMTHMFQFFKGAEEALLYISYDESGNPDFTRHSGTMGIGTQPTAYQTPPITGESRGATIRDTVRYALEPVPFHPNMTAHQMYMPPVVVEDDHPRGGISAPPSLAASHENLVDGRSPRPGTPVNPFKRHSTDLSRLEEYDIMSQGSFGSQDVAPRFKGHRRSGSYGTPGMYTPVNYSQTPPPSARKQAGRGHRRVGSDEYYQVSAGSGSSTPRTASPSPVRVINPQSNHAGSMHHVSTYPGSLSNSHVLGGSAPIQATEPSNPPNDLSIPSAGRSVSWTPGVHIPLYGTGISSANADAMNAMNMVSLSLDHQLQPLAPAPNCEQSMAIYMEHCQLAEQYVMVQTEIALLIQRKHELIKEYEQAEKGVAQNKTQRATEYSQLSTENESLLLLHTNLKKQVEQIRRQQQHRPRQVVT